MGSEHYPVSESGIPAGATDLFFRRIERAGIHVAGLQAEDGLGVQGRARRFFASLGAPNFVQIALLTFYVI